MPRLTFRTDHRYVLSEMKFIRWKHSWYSLQNSSVPWIESKPSFSQMNRWMLYLDKWDLV
jgi:hypothetical protein